MNVRISTYARRLMELVTQEDLIDVCYKDLKEINDEINSDEELLKFITSADKSIDEKKARLQEIFENDLDEAVLHAFFLSSNRSRANIWKPNSSMSSFLTITGPGASFSALPIRPEKLRKAIC